MTSLSLDIARYIRWSTDLVEQLIGFPDAPVSVEDGYAVLGTSVQPVPDGLVPIAMVDDRSVACVVTRDGLALVAGSVVRWHLDDVPERFQGLLLDTSAVDYLKSLEAELVARPLGYDLMTNRIMPSYEAHYLKEHSLPGDDNNDDDTPEQRRDRLRAQVSLSYERPRGEVLRPVRMACQNVVIGLAAMAYDAKIDGLAVAAWQTCEVPHVATHEANRALLALTLCDAFATGGTMEVRFDRPRYLHPEGCVPASLARYARTAGIDVYDDADPGGLSPAQSRTLFRACTPMAPHLRRRVDRAVRLGLTSVERICYTILSQTLTPIAMDFLLATTDRIGSILRGGDDRVLGRALAAELVALETAILLGHLVTRLELVDNAGSSVRVIEAQRHLVDWQIDSATGAVAIQASASDPPNWPGSDEWPPGGKVIVIPRARPSASTYVPDELDGVPVLALVPSDEPAGPAVLRAPVRVSELRLEARRVLGSLRSARA